MFKWYNYIISSSLEQGTLMEYQQKRVFHVFLVLLALCIPAYMYMISFPNKIYYYLNGALFIATILFVIAYFTNKIKLNTAFYFILISIHIEIGTEIIYCSTIDEYPYKRLLIMGNIILSVLFTMFSVCAYMSKTTIQISLISVLSYTVCVFITNGPFLTNYLPIIVIIFTVKSLFGILLHRNISCLQQENDMLKKEESTLLKVLQVNREELFALAELISKEISEDNINSLLDVVGEKTRKTLFMALHAHLKEEKSRLEIIRKIYPELSIAYLQHIPFPYYELFRILPQRAEILKGLLGADFIAFHTHDYMRHFISAVERVLHLDFKLDEVQINNRGTRVEAIPMGINYES